MGITDAQLAAVRAAQHGAAHDSAPQVRLVAGPGTGKSFAIGERVRHLLSNGVPPDAIVAVSFTRASAADLGRRIVSYCASHGCPKASEVRVTTLHSLALRMLRRANLLSYYPSDPMVLDSWEVEHVYDLEFTACTGISGKTRCREIRSHHEAFWSTGSGAPPNYIPADPPISETETRLFRGFHAGRSQLYCCVLPGEIVRRTVERTRAGVLVPAELLGLSHLIVDEFQDLNPMDLDLVDELIAAGVVTFVAGDDDQSIYSFRHANPEGIQSFPVKHSRCSQHALEACLRCTPAVLSSGTELIESFASPKRIPKRLFSAYADFNPPVGGIVHLWRLKSEKAEARAIASSCRDLIGSGIDPAELMILVSNRSLQSKPILDAFREAEVAIESPTTEGLLDTDLGRAAQAIVRIACDSSDYFAHRVLLGIRHGVGIGTCRAVADAVLAANGNFRGVFYEARPPEYLHGRARKSVAAAQSVCNTVLSWEPTDTISDRGDEIEALLLQLRPESEIVQWRDFSSELPPLMSLQELRDYLWADSPSQQARVLEEVYNRLEEPIPSEGVLSKRVRLMTMHGAKGLDAKVVFIPGLEDEILPGPWRVPYPGLVLEAARLLYVSVTRARAACIVSYSMTRQAYGSFCEQTPSRFCSHLSGAFQYRDTALSPQEAAEIEDVARRLE